MEHMPTIRVEIEGIRQAIVHLFNQNNKELASIVSKTIEDRLNAEWVQSEINQNVDICIRKAIGKISDNWELQTAISSMISEQISKLINPK